ncbi:MAG TPA: TPM domain-containing protein, partial [Tepidisphaeraceae bacterium]|nr:TPM domain-containing protein [Tepidisphaeraceae bacterium]
MFRKILLHTWLIGPLLLLAGASHALGANGVRDQAHFFSPAAISQAESIIAEIEQRHQKDVLVETFPEVPAEFQGQPYDAWVEQIARSEAVDGILIVITRHPGHIQVWVGNKTEARLFPLSQRQQLEQRMVNAFKQRQFDQGLIDGLRFIQQQMDSRRQGATSNVPSGGYSPPFPSRRGNTSWGIGGIACLIIGIVLLIALVRGIFGRSSGGYYGGGGGGYY